MAFEQILLNLAVGLGVGGLVAAIAKLESGEEWDGRKFIYSIIIGGFAGLAVIQGLEGGNVTEDNFVNVLLLIFGGSFLGNKGIGTLQRLTSASKKK
jgi:hypothetical protein